MTKAKNPIWDDMWLYIGRFINQFGWNPELPYYIIIATLLQAAVFSTVNAWAIGFFLIQYTVIALAAVINVSRRVDRAFQSLPIDFK